MSERERERDCKNRFVFLRVSVSFSLLSVFLYKGRKKNVIDQRAVFLFSVVYLFGHGLHCLKANMVRQTADTHIGTRYERATAGKSKTN
jgi:hypothetical protein